MLDAGCSPSSHRQSGNPAIQPIPTGLHPNAQGCAPRATLGQILQNAPNPERVASTSHPASPSNRQSAIGYRLSAIRLSRANPCKSVQSVPPFGLRPSAFGFPVPSPISNPPLRCWMLDVGCWMFPFLPSAIRLSVKNSCNPCLPSAFGFPIPPLGFQVGGDDAADCLRYLVATKSRTVTQRKLRGL